MLLRVHVGSPTAFVENGDYRSSTHQPPDPTQAPNHHLRHLVEALPLEEAVPRVEVVDLMAPLTLRARADCLGRLRFGL